MLAQQPASARNFMDGRLRRLLPSWLSSQQPSSSHSNNFPESDPQRTGSVGCKVSALSFACGPEPELSSSEALEVCRTAT